MSDKSSVLNKLDYNPMLCQEIGDCPNIELPTKGGQIFWETLDEKKGWKLQKNHITGLSRILDEKNIRKAWGSPVIMKEKFKRLTRKEFLEPGDVVGVVRNKALNLYEHYAVYIGKGMVVHYAGESRDFKGQVCVRKDSLDTFLGTDKNYFVFFFDKSYSMPRKIQVRTSFNMNDVSLKKIMIFQNNKTIKIYSPKETMERALSRLGERKYNLLMNNCEHFAVWCKTGVSKSYQVDRFVKPI